MTLLAAVLVGVVAYLAVGAVIGYYPRPRAVGERSGWPRRRRTADRRVWLVQAGTELTRAQFLAGSVSAGVLAFALVALVTDDPVVAVVPAVTIAGLPWAFFGRRRARRMAEVRGAWPDGIRHVIAGIQSGMSLSQAVTSLATSGPGPLQGAFGRFGVNARMMGVPAALDIVKEQLADPTSDRVTEVLLLAHERGGRIVTDVLGDLADATARDLKTQEEIASDALEPKINSRAVFALPWVVLVLLCATPGPIRAFYATAAGVGVIVAAAAMSVAGLLLVERISRQPVEERVFGRDSGT